LGAADAAGLVHANVKPSNILLGENGRVYLSDFEPRRDASFLGTYDYAAPELLEGKPVDGRSDLYALGCVLFQCLTGRPPFTAANESDVMRAHLLDTPPPPSALVPGVPAGLDDVVAKALAKDPGDRYGTADELVAALDDVARRPAAAAVVDGSEPDQQEVDGATPVAAADGSSAARWHSRHPLDRLPAGAPKRVAL